MNTQKPYFRARHTHGPPIGCDPANRMPLGTKVAEDVGQGLAM